MGRVPRRQVENRRHLSLCLAVADKAAVAARPERQRERIEKNGFAGAGFAGEDREAGREVEIELIDQHHVADGETREHWARSAQEGMTAW